MTRVSARTNFRSSTLIRQLAELDAVDLVDPGSGYAEKLGAWIHFADAIALSAVHADSLPARLSAAPQATTRRAADAAADLERTRALLADAIARSFAPGAVRSHNKLPAPLLELPLDLPAAFAPYRRFHLTHQRDMELGIQPLRVNLREALAKASPRLRKLAELDAIFEKVLRERESKLLSRVPALLAKRFEQLFKDHQQALAESGQDDKPAGWIRPGGWLTRFCQELQAVLLAELELRLQPATGLIEAFNQDSQ